MAEQQKHPPIHCRSPIADFRLAFCLRRVDSDRQIGNRHRKSKIYCRFPIADFRLASCLRGVDSHRQIGNRQSKIKNVWTCSSGESERDSAKVEVARSNRARSARIQTRRNGDTETRRSSLEMSAFAASPHLPISASVFYGVAELEMRLCAVQHKRLYVVCTVMSCS